MSVYEIISVVLSSIAIIVSVYFPIKNFVTKARVNFYPVGLVTLLFNQSGSYIQLNGVIESEKKAVSVRKMSVKIKREKDNQTINLSWSYLISPVNQRLVGNILQTTECAHPFRVEKDSIAATFVEYTDPFDSFGRIFRNSASELNKIAEQSPIFQANYSEAVKTYTESEEFTKVKQIAEKEFFWEIGKYSLDVIVNYNNSKKVFNYAFTITEQEFNELKHNIDEALLAALKLRYNEKLAFHSSNVELLEK